MIRPCELNDHETMAAIVNDAAQAYRGVIPDDRWHEPYMPLSELRGEIAAGVRFSGYEVDGRLVGVMGIQEVGDVTLIRHAYVLTELRGQGIGGKLLAHLLAETTRPVLIGTWAAATWAIGFYRRHGFRQVDEATKEALLRRYWSIPERQVATSVVLADSRWWAECAGAASYSEDA